MKIKETEVIQTTSRMDVIGQNGNTGLHYGEIDEPDNDAISYIEKNYPETAKEFQRLQFEQWELFCKKQMDYGPTNISMGTPLATDSEKRLSLVGLIVRINDKVQRLLNLMVKNNREAQNEPSIDAFKDLACYGIIAQIVQNGKWGK
tara:strand:- start:273 stop:713 length:441 start_codon:yes stop_codon:yes gene_type:complete